MAEAHGPAPITRILEGMHEGDPLADLTFPWMYDELRRLAAAQLHRERPEHTLSPTALVHEAYLRLVGNVHLEWKSRSDVLIAAASAMRRVLVDHARRRGAGKRGKGWRRIELEDASLAGSPCTFDFLDLNAALEKLAALDERGARVVELRFFAGLTLDEIAEAVGVSRRTVAGDWAAARSWLSRELSASSG
jgi:RNA polymerase sigma factor (TIGR02999 family)